MPMPKRKPLPEREPSALVQLKVRMREEMRAEIEEAARKVGHSMNAEIVKRLERESATQELQKVLDYIDDRTTLLQEENRQLREELKLWNSRVLKKLDSAPELVEQLRPKPEDEL